MLIKRFLIKITCAVTYYILKPTPQTKYYCYQNMNENKEVFDLFQFSDANILQRQKKNVPF